jgi:hypothetical protein
MWLTRAVVVLAFTGAGCSNEGSVDRLPATPPRFERALYSVTHGANGFVAVGGDPTTTATGIPSSSPLIVTSTDGATWRRVELAPQVGSLFQVAYGNGRYVAVGGSSNTWEGISLFSTDGVNWTDTSRESPGHNWAGVVFGSGYFVGLREKSSAPAYSVVRSLDGVTWEEVSEQAGRAQGIVLGGGNFVAYDDGSRVGHSSDGETWTWSTLKDVNVLMQVRFLGGRFVLSGAFDCCYGEVAAGVKHFVGTSADGRMWDLAEQTSPLILARAVGGGVTVAVASPRSLITTTDGEIWTETYSVATNRLGDIAFVGGRFVVLGFDIVTSIDGQLWRSTPIP